MNALAYAAQLLGALPGLIQAGVDVMQMIRDGQQKLQEFGDQNRDPTPQEWDELNQSIADKRAQLHRP